MGEGKLGCGRKRGVYWVSAQRGCGAEGTLGVRDKEASMYVLGLAPLSLHELKRSFASVCVTGPVPEIILPRIKVQWKLVGPSEGTVPDAYI